MRIRKHIQFYGRVQGVGFRYHATYKARFLGLTGWVRNCYDGTVEMEVQGEPEIFFCICTDRNLSGSTGWMKRRLI